MTVIVCLDDRDGMLFNKRRQSSDARLRERVLELAQGRPLLMNGYSSKQFAGEESRIKVDESFLENADSGDYCFVENVSIEDYTDKIKRVIVYRWNRVYPSDFKFPAELLKTKWKLVESFEFAGNSHERITEEIYE